MRSMSQLHENTEMNGNTRFNGGSKQGTGVSLETDLNKIDEEANKENGETPSFQKKEEVPENNYTQSILRNRSSMNRFNNHRNSISIRNKRHSHHRISADVSEQEEEEIGTDYPNMDKILKLDIFARTVFPLSYVILTVAYFVYYMGSR